MFIRSEVGLPAAALAKAGGWRSEVGGRRRAYGRWRAPCAIERPCYDRRMANVTISVKHMPSEREQPCGVCGAAFVPAEDSGSRVFSMRTADQQPFTGLLCGGCASKWTHGATVTVRPSTTA